MTSEDWQSAPANRWSFQHIDDMFPTVVLSRGSGPVLPLTAPQHSVEVSVDGFLEHTFTDGLLVLRGNEIVVERYLNGMTPDTRHLLQSVSKSMCSAVFGRYVASGQVSVDATVGQYLPELIGSAYGSATVQQVLDMTVAVRYVEDYEDLDSEVAEHERVGGWRTARDGDPPDTYSFLTKLQASGEHGKVFSYCSANTEVLAWLLERVTGQPFARLLTTDLWAQIGAEFDASVTVDRAGFPMASGGINVTLRDLARFGRVILDGGIGPDGGSVIPTDWIADTRRGGDPDAASDSMGVVHPGGSYRNQFWISADADGCFYGVGIYGQYVWMNPATDVVIAKVSSLPLADDDGVWAEHVAFFDGLSHGVHGS